MPRIGPFLKAEEIADDGYAIRDVGRLSAIFSRNGIEVRAYRNRCPHQARRLDGAPHCDGILTCPHHSVRFDLANGSISDDCGFLGIEPLERLEVVSEPDGLYLVVDEVR